MTNYLNAFESTLFSPGFRNGRTGYAHYIDVDSFIDYHWLTELSKNMDGYRSSHFLHKDRGGKLKMGPVWDWDLAFGNAHYDNGWMTNDWRWEKMRDRDYLWYKRLFEDPDFLQRYIDRWTELRTNIFATSRILARVDALAARLQEAQQRNYKRWPTIGKYVHPNKFIGKTYEEEVNWLKEWIKGRLEWIDSQDFPPPAVKVAKHPAKDEMSVLLSGRAGRVFYTLDGSDPRLSGGGVSPKAFEYRAPISIEVGKRIKARLRSDYNLWSAPKVVRIESELNLK